MQALFGQGKAKKDCSCLNAGSIRTRQEKKSWILAFREEFFLSFIAAQFHSNVEAKSKGILFFFQCAVGPPYRLYTTKQVVTSMTIYLHLFHKLILLNPL